MKNIIFIFLSMFCVSSFGQKLSCEDFKEGSFTATISEPVELNYKIMREGNKQIETI